MLLSPLLWLGLTACEAFENFDADEIEIPDMQQTAEGGDSLNPNLVVVTPGDANPGGAVTRPPRDGRDTPPDDADQSNPEEANAALDGAIDLLDAELSQWTSSAYGADGEIWMDGDGNLNLGVGGPLTGLRFTGDLETLIGPALDDYEIRLEAARLDGHDFFLGLTIPVGTDGHVTLVMGGWAGSVTGLSSLDGRDASDNRTTKIIQYENQQWYEVRVRVTPDRIEAWLDGESIVEVPRAEHETFSLRPEVLNSLPLGLCTYQTHGAIRGLTIRSLAEEADDRDRVASSDEAQG